MVHTIRWAWSAVLLAVVSTACSDPEAEVASDEAPEPRVPAWAVGADVGEHFGPYPADASDLDAAHTEWFAVVLPDGDPIDAFHSLVADAAVQGYDTGMADGGACQQYWQRDEVAVGEEIEGEGDGFQGETPFGEPLPPRATVISATCTALVEGGGERVSVSVLVPLEGTLGPVVPRRPTIVLHAPEADEPTVAFRAQDVDVAQYEYVDGPLTLEDLGGSTLVEIAPLVPLGTALIPNDHGGCLGAVFRSASPPAVAVDEVVAQSMWATSFEPATEGRLGGQRAAVRRGSTGGGLFYASAVETSAGSDIFICSMDN